jgi:hypothetical protein
MPLQSQRKLMDNPIALCWILNFAPVSPETCAKRYSKREQTAQSISLPYFQHGIEQQATNKFL